MDDLPEIKFKEKKEEKRKGFLAWFRSRLGIGGRGASGGAGEGGAGIGARAAGMGGRAAFGAGRFGASGWLGGLLSGNGGMLFTSAIVAAVLGAGIYMSSRDNGAGGSAAFSSNKTGDSYVPLSMRQQRSGSSLDMFKDANKSKYDKDGYDEEGYDEEGYDKDGYDKDGYDRDGYDKNGYDRNGNPKYDKDGYDKEGYDKNGYDKDGYDRNGYDKNGYDKNGYDRNGNFNPDFRGAGSAAGAGGVGGAGDRGAGRLAGGGFGGGLSGSLGGGSSSGPGGLYGNKAGGLGSKVNFGKVGAGFQNLPKFDDQRKKLLAMTGSARPVMSGGRLGGGSSAGGKGSWGQARGVKSGLNTLRSGDYTIDEGRGTQDGIWNEGTTTDGLGTANTGGTGTTSGKKLPVITTQPTIDYPSGNTGGIGQPGSGSPPDVSVSTDLPNVPVVDVAKSTKYTEMESVSNQAMTYLLLAASLALIGAGLVKWGTALMANPYTATIGAIIRAIGMGLALAAIAMGMYVMFFLAPKLIGMNNALGGAVYLIGGALAVLAGISALAGATNAVLPAWLSNVTHLATYAILAGLVGTMMGSGPIAGLLGK